MTNRDMVKNASAARAGADRRGRPGEVPASESERHHDPDERGPDGGGSQIAQRDQFPPTDDPLDSNQLKPMINARQHPGLKRPPE